MINLFKNDKNLYLKNITKIFKILILKFFFQEKIFFFKKKNFIFR